LGGVWLVSPESPTQWVTGVGGVGTIELKEPARDCGSHTLNHDVEGGYCRCAKGGVSQGPTCCTRQPY
jgi:hypothetical protein